MDELPKPIEIRFDRLDDYLERMEGRLDQYHGETRELVASMFAALKSNAAAMLQLSRALTELGGEVRDGRDQLRANTEAVLRMLDRLDGGGPAPAGA
jgi:hypothetical protein